MPFQKRKRKQQGRKQKRKARKEKKHKTTRKHWGIQRQNTGKIKTKIYAVSKAKTGPTRKKTKEKSKKRKKNKQQLENIGEKQRQNTGNIKTIQNKNKSYFKCRSGNNSEQNTREKQEKETKTNNN